MLEKKLKLYAKAIISFNKGIDNTKKTSNAYTYYKIGNCYLKMNKLKSAERYFLKAIRCNKKMHESFKKLAVVNGKTNRYFEGLQFIKSAVKIKPNNVNYQFIFIQYMVMILNDATFID